MRLGLIVALIAAWVLGNLAFDFFRRRREKALAAGVAAPEPDPSARAATEKSAAMGERMSEALALLKKRAAAKAISTSNRGTQSSVRRAPARRPRSSTPGCAFRSPPRWASAPSPGSAARDCATGGSPRMRC